MINVENLSVNISDTEILSEVSLTIAPGEVFGLVGESGSGKSMTALAMMRLLPSGGTASGAIELDGENLLNMSEAQMCDRRGRQLGMIFAGEISRLRTRCLWMARASSRSVPSRPTG